MVIPLFTGLVILLAAQAAATQPPAQPAAVPPAVQLAYVIGAGDVLSIKVLDEPELSREYSVDVDGTITFPFLNRVSVANKTVKQIEVDLTSRLTPNWLKNPQVAVAITQFRSRYIFVLGEVKAPGKYSIEGGISLLEVIAKAGSLTATAGEELRVLRSKDSTAAGTTPALPDDERTTEVLRVKLKELTEGRTISNIMLQDGDTLIVPQADRFFIGGQVRSPGSYPLTPGLTVRQALFTAGGLTERGSDRGIKIRRTIKGKETEIDARYETVVLPGDVITFRPRRI